MIAYAGMQRLNAGTNADLTFKANPRWTLDSRQSSNNRIIHKYKVTYKSCLFIGD